MPKTSSSSSDVIAYSYPRSCPTSEFFRVRVNGEPVFVHHTNVADFAGVSFSSPVEIEVEIDRPVSEVTVRPLRHEILPEVQGNIIRFSLENPKHLQIEINGLKPLHFHGNSPEENIPSSEDPNVLYFRAGQVHEVGELVLQSHQTLYIEGGAVLKGSVTASEARGIRIAGRGILDGSYFGGRYPACKSIVLDRCEDVVIEDITMIEPSSWMVLLGGCRKVHIRNLKEIGEVIGSDGVDIVGSTDVLIEDCFLKNNDDCIAVKSCLGDKVQNWRCDVDQILIQRCVFMNDKGGNAMEIGHELSTNEIRGITFRDCDVLHVHGNGAVFSIHNSDRALVRDILWEDIRVEHCYDSFIDIRVLLSFWTSDEERGRVRDIRFKNIHWHQSIHNPGYTKSFIGGWDDQHMVEGVQFEDIFFDDQKIVSLDRLDLFTKAASGIVIR